jgi:hypothetical protein
VNLQRSARGWTLRAVGSLHGGRFCESANCIRVFRSAKNCLSSFSTQTTFIATCAAPMKSPPAPPPIKGRSFQGSRGLIVLDTNQRANSGGFSQGLMIVPSVCFAYVITAGVGMKLWRWRGLKLAFRHV